MDISELTRDGNLILDAIEDNESAAVWVAKKPVSIIFPTRYVEGRLGSLDSRFNVVGIFMIKAGNAYDVLTVPALVPLSPTGTTFIKIENDSYYELSWEPGDIICHNTNLVRFTALGFQIYDEFIAKGRLPPYFDNLDHVDVIDMSKFKDFATVNLGTSPFMLSIFNASMTRNPDNRNQLARELYTKQSDFLELPVDRVPLRSVAYGADNTTSRLLGSYLNQGMLSSLVNPSEQTENIEQLLTS
jgi:hypothetical protein